MIRLAINGYGRIGRCVLRALYESEHRGALQVVAINELADAATVLHLSKYDSTHGRFPLPLTMADEHLLIDGQEVELLHRQHIEDLPWASRNIDLVMECTGTFSDRASAQQHLDQGAEKLMFSQPAQDDVDATG